MAHPNKALIFLVTASCILLISCLSAYSHEANQDCDIIVEASVEISRIGKPGDRIDAYVRDNHEQNFFVKFHIEKIIKGIYKQQALGVRLHSPSITFGITKENYKKKILQLCIEHHKLKDGRTIRFVHKL